MLNKKLCTSGVHQEPIKIDMMMMKYFTCILYSLTRLERMCK